MSVLTIDSEEYPVMAGVQVDMIRMDSQRRAWSGVMRTSLPSDTLSYVRVWSVSLGYLTVAETNTLMAVLTGTTAFAINGELPGESVSCLASDIERQDGPLEDMVTVRCRLEEVGS
jgi:hypothetical protein